MKSGRKKDKETFLEHLGDTKNQIEQLLKGLVEPKAGNSATNDAKNNLDTAIELYKVLERDYNVSKSIFSAYRKKKICKQFNSIWGQIEEQKKIVSPEKPESDANLDVQASNQVPDLDTFTSLNSIPDFEAENQKSFHDRTDEEMRMSPEETNGLDLHLERLTNCNIEIRGHPESVFLNHLKNCHLKIGPVTISVFVTNCHDSQLELCSSQIRIQESDNCVLRLRSTNKIMIEHCSNAQVGKYAFTYRGIGNDLKFLGIDEILDQWDLDYQIFPPPPQNQDLDQIQNQDLNQVQNQDQGDNNQDPGDGDNNQDPDDGDNNQDPGDGDNNQDSDDEDGDQDSDDGDTVAGVKNCAFKLDNAQNQVGDDDDQDDDEDNDGDDDGDAEDDEDNSSN